MKLALVLLAIVALASAAPKTSKRRIPFSPTRVETIEEYHLQPGIINGQEAEPHSIPYQAHIQFTGESDEWYCSGALISKRFIVTAAQCTYGAKEALIVLGAHNIQKMEQTARYYPSYKIISHEQYKFGDIHNNIALIEIHFDVQINDWTKTIRIPNDNSKDFAGSIIRVSGWGFTGTSDDSFSDVLNYFEDKVITNEECKKSYANIGDGEICVTAENKKTICHGDTGAPATVDGVLVGIASFSDKDCEGTYPSGYTRIGYFIDWIRKHSDYQ